MARRDVPHGSDGRPEAVLRASMDEYNPALRMFFDGIDASELAVMQTRREEEGLRLDFKRGSKDGEPSKDDLANLRKAVSGFANSEGGVVLWGVESKREGDRADRNCFAKIEPISDGAKFVARLQDATGNATSPPVNGVVHRVIAIEGGFVVKTLVPMSDQGHQDARELVYWRRYADRFRKMQDFEVREMLGRRARPALRLQCSPSPSRGGRLFSIHNAGRGIARYVCMVLRSRPGADTPQLSHVNEQNRSVMRATPPHPDDGRFEFVRSEEIIHPGRHLEVCVLSSANGEGFYRLDFTIYAEGMDPVEGTVRLWGRTEWKLESPEQRSSSVP